jgi:hypothetical protein
MRLEAPHHVPGSREEVGLVDTELDFPYYREEIVISLPDELLRDVSAAEVAALLLHHDEKATASRQREMFDLMFK